MKLEPGERGLSTGRDLATTHCARIRCASSLRRRAGHPLSSFIPRVRWMALRAHSDDPQGFELIRPEERRCATRSGSAARASGLSAIYGGDARSIKEEHIFIGGRLDMHGPTLESLIEVLG